MKSRGVVLVMVLVAVALASMVVAGVLFRMQAALAASAATGSGEQAYEAAMSGVRTAVAVLNGAGDDAEVWRDNPAQFLNQFVCDDGANCWYFTVYAYNPSDPSLPRYGLTDESGKVDVNTAPAEMLRLLPGMTEELADCLIDYRDKDDEPEPQGAEQEDYDRLPWPYLIRNDNLATLEELLLVKGFAGSIVYGEDANFNGVLDANENDGAATFPPDNADGELNVGLRGLATTFSYAPNVDSQGAPRVRLSSDGAAQLRGIGLSQATADFVAVYLAEGKSLEDPSQLLDMRYQTTEPHRLANGTELPTGSWIESGVGKDELPIVCDRLTCSGSGRGGGMMLRGRINVNTASAQVLAAVPGIGEGAAQTIVDVRGSLDASVRSNIAWLYTEDVLGADDFRRAAPLLGARGYQYRVQSIGFGVPCGRIRVIEAVVDTITGGRIVYLRDITRLGAPVSLNVEQEVGE